VPEFDEEDDELELNEPPQPASHATERANAQKTERLIGTMVRLKTEV
jgi:hypothetical protein